MHTRRLSKHTFTVARDPSALSSNLVYTSISSPILHFGQVNPCKLKKVTNVRSVLADETFKIAPPVRMGTEEMIAYMGEDEMLEITPAAIRLRKASLDAGERQRLQRSKKSKK